MPARPSLPAWPLFPSTALPSSPSAVRQNPGKGKKLFCFCPVLFARVNTCATKLGLTLELGTRPCHGPLLLRSENGINCHPVAGVPTAPLLPLTLGVFVQLLGTRSESIERGRAVARPSSLPLALACALPPSSVLTASPATTHPLLRAVHQPGPSSALPERNFSLALTRPTCRCSKPRVPRLLPGRRRRECQRKE